MREEYHGAFVDLGLVTSEGVQIAYAGPFNLELVNYSESEWFVGASRQETYISDVFTGLRGTPHFIVATHRSFEGQDYMMRATIDFESFNALVENFQMGSTGFAFIINRNGEFQTKPRFEVSLNSPPYVDLLEGRTRADRIFTVEGRDAFGRESIFTIAPLKQGQWFLCYQQETADAFSEMRRVHSVAITTFLVASASAALLSFVVLRSRAKRIAAVYRERTVMTHQVIETGRLASIGELAAGIAHEINNPVAIMVEEAGWIEDLLQDCDPESNEGFDEISRAVAQIKTQGERCKEITYKLLSFARKTDPTVREVALNDIVNEVMGLVGQKTRYAKVEIETRLSPMVPVLKASPTELQQVILNLVNNAIDAIGKDGGTVTVTTRQDEDEVILEVADTGEGIPEANLARIFDPFFTTKPVGQGTGLGLSICFGIIEKMGGRIVVDSEVGQGTTFSVHLPIDAESDGGSEPDPEEERTT
jgi:two-component system NtrC family sensor kinase